VGTNPANEVAQKAIEVLGEEGIIWNGKPKFISEKEPIDIVVTMGCEVTCHVIPQTKIVAWDIPDPKGKQIDEYRRIVNKY